MEPARRQTRRQDRGEGAAAAAPGFAQSEVTPLVVNGVMYIATPYNRVVALDPTTGKESWAFQLPSGNPSTRGVEYFAGDAETPPQIVFGTSNGRLFSLDAKTGVPNESSATAAASTSTRQRSFRGCLARTVSARRRRSIAT